MHADDQTDAGNQKAIAEAKARAAQKAALKADQSKQPTAGLASAGQDFNGLLAGLAALIKGKEDTQSARLQVELWKKGMAKLEQEFKSGI